VSERLSGLSKWSVTLCLLQLVIVTVMSPQCCLAEDLQVSSTGHGLNVKEATEDALQNAVRQALGAILTSETLVTQDDKLEENVVIFSNGFVQEYKVQGQPSVRSGIVSVTIVATVRKSDLEESLGKIEITTKKTGKVDGTSLYAQAFTKLNNRKAASKLISLLLRRRHKLIHAEAPPFAYDPATETLSVRPQFRLKKDDWKSFYTQAEALLGQLSTARRTVVTPALNVVTPPLKTKKEMLVPQYAFVNSDVTEAGLQQQRIKTIPSQALAVDLKPLLVDRLQQQVAKSWIVWLHKQASIQGVQWEGFVIETDIQELSAFFNANSRLMETKIRSASDREIATQLQPLTLKMRKPVFEAEEVILGLPAISSTGQLLKNLVGAENDEFQSFSSFWRQNQSKVAPKINVFLTPYPVIMTPPKHSAELIEKEKTAIMRLLHTYTEKPEGWVGRMKNTRWVAGVAVEQGMKMDLATTKEISKSDSRILLQHNQEYHLAMIEEKLRGKPNYQRDEQLDVTSLEVEGVKEIKDIMPHIQKITSLKNLRIENSNLTDDAALRLADLVNLRSLSLAGNPLTGRFAVALENAVSLKQLDLTQTQVNADLPALPSVESLRINRVTSARECLGKVSEMSNLRNLSLQSSKIGDRDLERLSNTTGLVSIRLDGTSVTDECIKSLIKLKNVTHLSIAKTRISDEGFLLLEKMPGLEHVEVGRGQISKECMADFSKSRPECEVVETEFPVPAQAKVE